LTNLDEKLAKAVAAWHEAVQNEREKYNILTEIIENLIKERSNNVGD